MSHKVRAAAFSGMAVGAFSTAICMELDWIKISSGQQVIFGCLATLIAVIYSIMDKS